MVAKKNKNQPALLFGPAGVPKLTAKRDTEAGIMRIKKVGLDCMEIEFVRGVTMGEKKADDVKATAEEHGIALTVHAPYYINLNSSDPKVVKASKQRIFDSARIGTLCGATSVAFHPGYYMGDPPKKVFRKVKKHLKEILRKCKSEGVEIQLRPETTGKPSQFGRFEEALALSAEIDGILPCVDFAHLHSYNGDMNSYDEFASALEKVRSELGSRGLADMHLHISGIHYGEKGELKHLNLEESDLEYVELLRALKDFSVTGRVICESPDQEADALLMKKKYRRIRKRNK